MPIYSLAEVHDRRMSARTFKICLALLALLIVVSSATFPGAIIGFLFGITVAFFIAPLTFLLEAAARDAGVSLAFHDIVYGLAALYGLAVLLVAGETYRARGDAAAMRLAAAKTLLLVTLPLIAWLSSQALVRAWPR